MLNRRTSNYIFYGTLFLILVVVLLVRVTVINSLDGAIDDVYTSNAAIQEEIDALREMVQDNKDIQIDHIYTLYEKVPSYYDRNELYNFTIAQLELAGVTNEPDILRDVDPDPNPTFPVGSDFADVQKDFKVVEVEVYFNTHDVTDVDRFIDNLYQAEQVFIVNSIEYYSPIETEYIGVSIKFLAFYTLEEQTQ